MAKEQKLVDISLIRNFSIIAHIDHGKSTLSDRIMEFCNAVDLRTSRPQLLDNLATEMERGITIKAQTVRLNYLAKDGLEYTLNLMDTPGHVDFAYEVSRSLAACEGSVLVVDATQGVEAQTLANVYKASESNHDIIPCINKIDLESADIENAKQEIEDIIGIEAHDAVLTSGKTGIGIQDLLEAIVTRIRPPQATSSAGLKALLIDSWYDEYLGVIILIRVFSGYIRKGMKIKMLQSNASYEVLSIGCFSPHKTVMDVLGPGEVGFITASIKQIADCMVGDTITDEKNPCEPLAGFRLPQSVVFCSLFPTDSSDYQVFKDSINKLHLNDNSFQFEHENSQALGFGFRCGFLGLLHLEVIQERLEDEFSLDLITTAPSVAYKVYKNDGVMQMIYNPADLPDPTRIDKVEEPWIRAKIMTPHEYMGKVIELCIEKRGIQADSSFAGNRAVMNFDMPLSEVIFDFYDRIKSLSSGYASLDWTITDFKEAPIVKLSILINSDPVDALSMLTHKARAEQRGREICLKLKELIPRQQYKVAIQAAIGGKIVAREDISAYRKDVTAKCYGGDISRKRKLLDKQKKGKKKMRMIGNIEIPQTAFIAALRTDSD